MDNIYIFSLQSDFFFNKKCIKYTKIFFMINFFLIILYVIKIKVNQLFSLTSTVIKEVQGNNKRVQGLTDKSPADKFPSGQKTHG